MKPQNPVIREQILEEELNMELRVSGYGQAYANALVMQAMDTTGVPLAHVIYDEITKKEYAILYTPKVPGAVRIYRSRPGGPATFPFGPILAKHPGLTVDKGYVRKVPVRLEETPEGIRLVLTVGFLENDVEPSKRKPILTNAKRRRTLEAKARKKNG